jgi:DNA-binding NarL/FixJ family response regulator
VTLVERLRRIAEDAQIQTALKDGKTIAQIVMECNVTVARVQKQRVVLRAILGDNRRTSTRARVLELTERGLTAVEIAERLAISASAVRTHRRHANNLRK